MVKGRRPSIWGRWAAFHSKGREKSTVLTRRDKREAWRDSGSEGDDEGHAVVRINLLAVGKSEKLI